jgi:DNA-binding transcriptional MerR regulator
LARQAVLQTRKESPDTEAAPLRMKDLVARTGVPRETIHFYMAEGLLPRPQKTSRTTAIYSGQHVERLLLIQDLRQRKFLPLRAIRVLLGEDAGADFTPAQRDFLQQARLALGQWLGVEELVPLAEGAQGLVSTKDLRDLQDSGFVRVRRSRGKPVVSLEDAEILAAVAHVRESRLVPEEFSFRDLAVFDQLMEDFVQAEAHLFYARWRDTPPKEAAMAVEQSAPIVDRLMAVVRRKKLRKMFVELQQGEGAHEDGP